MLNNTLYRLKTEKHLRLGFFGGSITDGTGASDMERTSYRAIVTDALRRSFPDAEIESVNASIGGTGTGYGMFRCRKDLLSKDPELIFVEFAVNDWGDSYENVLPRAESIFRAIRMTSPTADIVTVFSAHNEIAEALENGKEFESRSAIVTAAHRYKVATADPGAALLSRILLEGGRFDDYIPDTVHPNDDGHRIMGECIVSLLLDRLREAEAHGVPAALVPAFDGELPEPASEGVLDRADMIPARELEDLALDGFRLVSGGDGESFLEATEPGRSFSFTLRGRCLGFCWGGANINGDVEVTIDGGEAAVVPSWDSVVRSFEKMERALVTTSLDPSVPHRVTVTSREFSPTDASPDRVVRIGYVFVG